MKQLLRALVDQQAATTVEYAILLGLILLGLLGSVALVGEKGNGLWTSIQTNLNDGGVLK